MSSNPFALLDVDGQTETKKVAAPKKAAPKAAPKKDAKAVAAPQKKEVAPKTLEKKPLASGERDRHSKGGRNAGEANTKRPFDRSLNRQTTGQHERKGGDSKGVKGSWATKNPEADQVAADVEQKKDEAEAKVEEAKVESLKRSQKNQHHFYSLMLLSKRRQLLVNVPRLVHQPQQQIPRLLTPVQSHPLKSNPSPRVNPRSTQTRRPSTLMNSWLSTVVLKSNPPTMIVNNVNVRLTVTISQHCKCFFKMKMGVF